jgi:hypothetical protein
MGMQYFLNVNYKAYSLIMNTFKKVEMTVKVNELDVYDLDFFKLKFIQGKYYYLNKLQFKSGSQISEATLIEIPSFSSNQPVEALGSFTYNMSYGSTSNVSLNYLTTLTDPPYYDPENDEPLKIKFLNGNGSEIKLYQAGIEIYAGDEIMANDWDVKVIDQDTTTEAHLATWTYQIADTGSESYGDAVGTFKVNVRDYENLPPIADAGIDKVLGIDVEVSRPPYAVDFDGSGSYDYTGTIEIYDWFIVSKPVNSNATIANDNSITGRILIPNETESIGSYRMKLTVTDSFGLSSTDTVDLTVNSNPGGFEPA